MSELTIDNIELIAEDVRSQEIVFTHLADDLIDHICCDVESEMESGLTFYEAYARVSQKFGRKGLKEIQEKTLYATDTKYRIMKNAMKISALAGTILFGFAAMFKIQHWPGAGIMLTLGAVILTFVFIPSALVVLWKETKSSRKLFLFISAFLSAAFFISGILFKIQHWDGGGVLIMLAGISVIFLLIPSLLSAFLRRPGKRPEKPVYIPAAIGFLAFFSGFLFKVMHWQGSGVLLLGGLIILILIVLPWFTWLRWKDEEYVRPGFIFLVAGSLSIILPAAFLSMNLQRSFDTGFIKNLEEQQALFRGMAQDKNRYLALYSDSSSQGLMNEIDERTSVVLDAIASVEEKMINLSETDRNDPSGISSLVIKTEYGNEIAADRLTDLFNPYPAAELLMPGTGERDKLDDAIAGYRSFLSSAIHEALFEEIRAGLDPSVWLPVPASDEGSIPLIQGLHSLAVMKNGLMTIESYLLHRIHDLR